MKTLFQFIGFAVVVIVLLASVLFYLESKDLLEGDLGDFIHEMRSVWLQAKETFLSFLQASGIADDAADLLDQGADKLRATETPDLSAAPESTPIPVTTAAAPETTNFTASIVITTPAPN